MPVYHSGSSVGPQVNKLEKTPPRSKGDEGDVGFDDTKDVTLYDDCESCSTMSKVHSGRSGQALPSPGDSADNVEEEDLDDGIVNHYASSEDHEHSGQYGSGLSSMASELEAFLGKDTWARLSSSGTNASELYVPQSLDSIYEVQDVLGRGSQGVVKRVRQRTSGSEFALKTVHVDPFHRDAVEGEILCWADCEHPNILKLMHFFLDSVHDEYHLIMEVCAGGDLRTLAMKTIQECSAKQPNYKSGLPTGLVTDLTCQMLSGLEYFHGAGLIHRDIKPENYLITYEGQKPIAKLSDFGLVCRLAPGERLTKMSGTTHYVAPEVLNRQGYDQRADVWSLGVSLFGLATNNLPFDGDSERMYVANVKKINLAARPAAWVPHPVDLRRIIMSMLQREEVRPTASTLLHHSERLQKSELLAAEKTDPACCVIS